MLMNTKEILTQAQQGKYAVAAFNVYNLETAQAAIQVSEREGTSVIIALGERYFPTVDVEGFFQPWSKQWLKKSKGSGCTAS
ncbi:hypothetical protein GCM10020331_013890 [Ectobacillus funiculus]